jgi:hypothetical protein
MKIPHAVVELEVFVRAVSKLLEPEEIANVITYLAFNPDAGDLMKGTGGFRKLRWARAGKGKSGGVRVIYFLYNENFPLFLYTAYAKNDRANLTKAECNMLAKVGAKIIQEYEG